MTVVTGVGLLRNHNACLVVLEQLKGVGLVKEYTSSSDHGAIFVRLA